MHRPIREILGPELIQKCSKTSTACSTSSSFQIKLSHHPNATQHTFFSVHWSKRIRSIGHSNYLQFNSNLPIEQMRFCKGNYYLTQTQSELLFTSLQKIKIQNPKKLKRKPRQDSALNWGTKKIEHKNLQPKRTSYPSKLTLLSLDPAARLTIKFYLPGVTPPTQS